jgi:hypothetical protein
MSPEQDSNSIEERRFALDAEIRRREMALNEAVAKSTGLSAAQATVAGAVLALISGVIGASIAAWSSQNIEAGKSLNSLQIEELKAKGNLELEKSKQLATEALERKKFETSLILDAIKTNNRLEAVTNLKFFVDAGFVTDTEGKIAKLSDARLPSLTAASTQNLPLQTLLPAFDPPGFLDDLTPDQKPQWSAFISQTIDSEMIGSFSGGHHFYNATATDPGPTTMAEVSWNAFPRRMAVNSRSDKVRWQTADGSRDVQDEYLEWSVTRDAETSEITRVKAE